MIIRAQPIKENVEKIIQSLAEEIISLRRHFHTYPELSWEEYETASHLMGIFRAEGIEVNSVCNTGVVAEIGSGDGPTIAVRADMDALPLQDAKEMPYASKVNGVSHACGHDCHMAMAVGVAKVLRRLGLKLPGKVKFIFQPSEEASPSGAHEIVNSGAMEDVEAILCFHVDPEIPAGMIGLKRGVLTAHCTEFNITLHGRSGHAARPHQAIDTIYLANQVLSLLYDIVGSRSQPFMPAVLTVGKVQGGTKANVIPDKVEIAGTVRSIDEQSHCEILSAIEIRTKAMAKSADGSCIVNFLPPIPSVYNNPGMVELVRGIAEEIINKDKIININKVSMGGEDFSWYLTKAPGVLIRLGSRKKTADITYLHTSCFDIDESALPLGISIMSMVLLKYFLQDSLVFD